MRTKIAAATLVLLTLTSAPVFAQPAPDPQKQALGQMVMEAANREANYRALAIAAQQQVDALKARLEAVKACPVPKPAAGR